MFKSGLELRTGGALGKALALKDAESQGLVNYTTFYLTLNLSKGGAFSKHERSSKTSCRDLSASLSKWPFTLFFKYVFSASRLRLFFCLWVRNKLRHISTINSEASSKWFLTSRHRLPNLKFRLSDPLSCLKGSPFPSKSHSGLTPNLSSISLKTEGEGLLRPSSYRETLIGCIPKASANSFCDKPKNSRSSFIRWPIATFSPIHHPNNCIVVLDFFYTIAYTQS